MRGALNRIAGAFKLARNALSYDEEKLLARHSDVAVRARLAAREDARPEILYYLAEDPAPEVRRNIAANAQTPRHADLVLARDGDEVVRCDLVAKIARLAPGLSANEQEQVRLLTYQVLEILARDQLVRVRRILAETLKDMADAPVAIIGQLARDTEVEVAGPVLRSSPVLTDEDLLEIIRTCSIMGPLTAISQRAHVGSQASDAIAESDDVEAIGALLANPSAQIREETLDRLVDRAPEIEAWHKPLTRRPKLSPRAVTKIASFVADSLIAVLQARGDLDPATVKVLKSELQSRLGRDGGAPGAEKKDAPAWPCRPGANGGPAAEDEAPARADTDAVLARVKHMHAEGQLSEEAVSSALAEGNRRFVAAALSVLSNLPLALVEKVAESQSARGVTALCWKAGLRMRFATMLQIRFAHIAPNAAVGAVDMDKYPLTPEEMDWQIDFFGTMVPAGAKSKMPSGSRG
jgi:uncharacterized protein (DUF2336 family)